jgi:hypothetical protein
MTALIQIYIHLFGFSLPDASRCFLCAPSSGAFTCLHYHGFYDPLQYYGVEEGRDSRWEFAGQILQQHVACSNRASVWPGKFHKTLQPRQRVVPGREGVLGNHPGNRGAPKCTHSRVKSTMVLKRVSIAMEVETSRCPWGWSASKTPKRVGQGKSEKGEYKFELVLS